MEKQIIDTCMFPPNRNTWMRFGNDRRAADRCGTDTSVSGSFNNVTGLVIG